MKSATSIARRDRDSSLVLSKENPAKGKDNKRSTRAFGPVDVNTINGRQHIAGDKVTFILPKSPNLAPKKKPKPAVSDPGSVGCKNSSVSQSSLEAAQQPKCNSSETDADAVLSALKSLTIGSSGTEPATQEKTEIDWKPIQEELDALFVKQSEERMKGVPMIEMPKIFEKNGIQLFDHQKDGIRWLVHKEVTNTDIPPYYTLRKYGRDTWYYNCTIDRRNYRDENGPKPIRHSILADDMGLGKTLQSIGLILSNPPTGRDGIKAYPYKMPRRKDRAPPRCTIIISPVSVMSNWMMEIDKFVHKKKKNILKVETYQGPSRIDVLRKAQEGKLDILICSYQTLAWDLKKYRKMQEEKALLELSSNEKSKQEADSLLNNGDPIIFDLEFHRIILDEAHMIRNDRTLYFQSVNSLIATHKLCLTGTPFVNHPRDIQSFLNFLEVAPCNNKETFNHYIVEQIEQRKEVGLARLRVLMSAIAIRRTKQEVGDEIQLPEQTVQIRKIPFPESCEHQEINHMLYHSCRTAFLALSKADSCSIGRKPFLLLGMVLRVRQSCCDASLVPARVREEVAALWEDFRYVIVEDLNKEEGIRLFEKLLDALAVAKAKIEIAKAESLTEEEDIDDFVQSRSDFGRSPKVEALMEAISEMKPDEKGVIFSQWTQFLDIIQSELELEGLSFLRIDGTMDANERYEAMKSFDGDGPRLILCSLKACNTGINLTRANHVFAMDTWWNVAEENQAMDRVHRIGQSRPVRVIRFIMKDSIEERFIEVQDAKMALAKGSMERLKKEDRRKASITALTDLFEMKARAHVWEGTFVDDDAFDDDLDDFIVPDDHFE